MQAVVEAPPMQNTDEPVSFKVSGKNIPKPVIAFLDALFPDSVRIDTLYRMHLKYALVRQKGLSRAQNLERMQAIHNELKNLLTPEEFERFMNHPAELPRRPRGAAGAPARQAATIKIQQPDRQ